ncbi:MAG: 1-acyl-sn-glycerol-3-phosphate acyltransferase, partial [Actinomycetota bacterium]|nr:1-acyl-sn-glycerol-3-phosphate acyltransferase [Actinomycetota bacterium]
MRLRNVKVRPPFPIGAAPWPKGMPKPPVPSTTGIDYDTGWSRRYAARVVRAMWVDDVLRPLVHVLASPRVHGAERLADVVAPVIFAANHNSHIDTPLILSSLPERFRHRAVVAAAADYFFPTRAKGAVSALTIGAIPIGRQKINRKSSDQAAALIDAGWNLVIFPEGTRSPDGWGQDFRGGAAYLAVRCGRPVVPVYVHGTRAVLGKGDRWPTRRGNPLAAKAGVHILMGTPLMPAHDEDTRRFSARIQAAVAALGDEWATDWWSARRRA